MQYTCSFLEGFSSWKWLLERKKKKVLSVHWLDSHRDVKGKKCINTKNMRQFFFFEGCSCIHQCAGVGETTNETLVKPEVIVL